MHKAGALEGKNVLFLGDDDSISLAVGLVGKALSNNNMFARRLTVVEADQRILDHLKTASEAERLNIECILHDLREPLPEKLWRQFDTFETDPPYTTSGAALFVSRGIAGIKSGVGQQGFLSYGAKSPDESFQFAEALIEMGLATAQIIPAFNQYEGASLIGGVSQLIHLLSTSSTYAIAGHDFYSGPIYTGEASPTVRLYSCMRCGNNVPVGKGQKFETIEKLKASGCPRCGNKKFSYERRVAHHPKIQSVD
jgi:predicted methyltransferase